MPQRGTLKVEHSPARLLPNRARSPYWAFTSPPADRAMDVRLLGTRQTVILAAGNGSRLSAQRGDRPKPLVRVAGRALIDHALEQAALAGVEEAIIVTGKAADQMRAHLTTVDTPLKLTLVHNERYHDPNGVSLLCAEPFIDGPFYLQMADHVFAHPVLRHLDRVDAALPEAMRLLVDFHPVNLDEADATKVCVADGRITAIGKDVYPYDAVDTGCFRLDPRVFTALRSVAETEPPSVTLGMRYLLARGQLAPVSLTGVRWTDVDTPEDYAKAEMLLSAQVRRRAAKEVTVAA
jgi:1L-myo-inositol 1-phosphate cytidylyltransferase